MRRVCPATSCEDSSWPGESRLNGCACSPPLRLVRPSQMLPLTSSMVRGLGSASNSAILSPLLAQLLARHFVGDVGRAAHVAGDVFRHLLGREDFVRAAPASRWGESVERLLVVGSSHSTSSW